MLCRCRHNALCLKLFYRLGLDSCLEVDAKSVLFGSRVEGLSGMAYATAIDARHGAWSAQLPKDTADLWEALSGLDSDSRQALFNVDEQRQQRQRDDWHADPRSSPSGGRRRSSCKPRQR